MFARPQPRPASLAPITLLRQLGLSLAALALATLHAGAQAAPQPPSPDAGRWASELLQAINQHRQRQGQGALQPASDLQLIADDHSREMAAEGQLSHAGFDQRFARTTARVCVENLAAGHADPQTLITAWQASPAHARNLVEPRLRRAGVAAIGRYTTFFACD